MTRSRGRPMVDPYRDPSATLEAERRRLARENQELRERLDKIETMPFLRAAVLAVWMVVYAHVYRQAPAPRWWLVDPPLYLVTMCILEWVYWHRLPWDDDAAARLQAEARCGK